MFCSSCAQLLDQRHGTMSCVVFVIFVILFFSESAFCDNGISLDKLLQKVATSVVVTPPSVESWTGRYFPTPPNAPATSIQLKEHGGVAMGAMNADCDDGKTNLTVDWNSSPLEYTCFNPMQLFLPDDDVPPLLEIESIPKFYSAVHYCMNETIIYENDLPTFGPHRPAWPRYGEYEYLPVQRWLHNLEHGGIVMLYHPCAHPLEVERLRRIVRSCLYRHIISPSNDLTPQRPLALLSWGKRLKMSSVNKNIVKDFIMQNALHGPEKISRDGQFDNTLLKPASIVSDIEDTDLCPVKEFESVPLYW